MLDFIKYRLKYRYGQKLNLKTPVDISLELSSLCNQSCDYCYHSKSNVPHLPFEKGFMSLDMALDIIYQAAMMDVPSLKFNYRGESTMHKDFEKITQTAKNLAHGYRFQERISNSNFKFNPHDDSKFRGLANQTKVKISFDSFIPSVMEEQRAGSIHSLALKNIDKFYNWPKRKTDIVIQAVRTQLNKDEDIFGQSKKRWPEAGVSIRDVVSGRTESNSYDDLVNNKQDVSNRNSCLQAHVRMIVHHDGRIGPCCPSIRNDLIIGDMRKNSLYEVFNSFQAKSLRQDLKSKKAFENEPCKTCSSFESYRGYKHPWHS